MIEAVTLNMASRRQRVNAYFENIDYSVHQNGTISLVMLLSG